MSRNYNVSLAVLNADPARFRQIMAAASTQWPFDDEDSRDNVLGASGDGQLFGGELDEQLAERLTKAVWEANGGPCQVEIDVTDLDDVPCESHSFDQNDYDRLMNTNKEKSREESS